MSTWQEPTIEVKLLSLISIPDPQTETSPELFCIVIVMMLEPMYELEFTKLFPETRIELWLLLSLVKS